MLRATAGALLIICLGCHSSEPARQRAVETAYPTSDTRRVVPFGGRRLAMVVGNKSYSFSPLVNPINDAKAVANVLQEIGFAHSDVHLLLDANREKLRSGFREFVESVKPGDMAFIYYSGHGVEVKGANYLLPIDLPRDATETYVQDEAVSAQRVMRDLNEQGARVRVLILDACRDNPLRTTKSIGGGLAPMEGKEGKGSLIVFSTEAGHTATDSPDAPNSVFTSALVEGLRAPGVPLDEVMKRVSRNVARLTNEQQIPATYGLMLEDVILLPGGHKSVSDARQEAAAETWQIIKDSQNADDFEKYASTFPDSPRALEASVKARQLRDKILPVSVVQPSEPAAGTQKTGRDGLTYVWVPRGQFTMGCSPGDEECFPDERLQRQVSFEKGFWIGQTEVTQAAFQRMTHDNPSYFQGGNFPVERVRWDEARKYCESISMRLPSDAEWEYAARGGTSSARYGKLDDIAWYNQNSDQKTHPVKSKRPNDYGLYDMLGNVWEWTADWYEVDRERILRGGSWQDFERNARVSNRFKDYPARRNPSIGFRCVADHL